MQKKKFGKRSYVFNLKEEIPKIGIILHVSYLYFLNYQSSLHSW